MAGRGDAVLLPLTKTARTYGYVVWHRRHDEAVKAVLGKRSKVDLTIAGQLHKGKSIDWKQRRIGITYTLTRSLPKGYKRVLVRRTGAGQAEISFS